MKQQQTPEEDLMAYIWKRYASMGVICSILAVVAIGVFAVAYVSNQ